MKQRVSWTTPKATAALCELRSRRRRRREVADRLCCWPLISQSLNASTSVHVPLNCAVTRLSSQHTQSTTAATTATVGCIYNVVCLSVCRQSSSSSLGVAGRATTSTSVANIMAKATAVMATNSTIHWCGYSEKDENPLIFDDVINVRILGVYFLWTTRCLKCAPLINKKNFSGTCLRRWCHCILLTAHEACSLSLCEAGLENSFEPQ